MSFNTFHFDHVIAYWHASDPTLRWATLITCYLFYINLRAFFVFRRDKRASEKHEWRVPEITLLRLAALGGWFGARFAQKKFRHKTSKPSFKSMMNVAGAACAFLYLTMALIVVSQSAFASQLDMTPLYAGLGYVSHAAHYVYVHGEIFAKVLIEEFST